MRIVVAMSGGVDSSVAAAILQEAGHEVIGISMQLYDQRGKDSNFGNCCTIDDLHDARRVANVLKIPHYVVNFEQPFSEQILRPFVDEYAQGRTPIPCVHCNSELKFSTLLDRAIGLGATGVATGHHARVMHDSTRNCYMLKRGIDQNKDQSYFLFPLTQEQLKYAVFPVGHLSKSDVRAYARNHCLPVSDKPDSQELCFVPSGKHASFIEQNHDDLARTGKIVNTNGQLLGRHKGVHRFTVGQRKGLGISSPVPLYVLKIDAPEHNVVVGPREALEQSHLTASTVNWISNKPKSTFTATAQIRYQHPAAQAQITPLENNRVDIEFNTPQTAIAPGQAVVFFDGETVLGGGWIDSPSENSHFQHAAKTVRS